MRIAIDAMGGDNAPDDIVKGAVQSLDIVGKDRSRLDDRGGMDAGHQPFLLNFAMIRSVMSRASRV